MLYKKICKLLPSFGVCFKLENQLKSSFCFVQSRQTAKHVKPHKKKGTVERTKHFVDYVEVIVRGGNGGNGMISFSSLPNLEWAGPDGGNGGNGGHVIFKASHNVTSLAHLKPTIVAPRGVSGKTRQRDGKNASHLTIEVPFGTLFKSKSGRILASLDEADTMFIASRGGAGGKGNYFFLSNENRAPTIAETGGLGQEREMHVELKIMAHAGLIGFPNAGKSSLLRAISRAQPKVSPYPFTTLNPHIGMVLFDDHEQLAVADIPGLIPGSHLNKGMGHSFLRHVERCLCMIYVIDLALEKPWDQLEQLRYELNQYQPGLADRPALLVANKLDLPSAQERMEGLKEWMMKGTSGRMKIIQKKDLTDLLDRELELECEKKENPVALSEWSREQSDLLQNERLRGEIILEEGGEFDKNENICKAINEKEKRDSDLFVIGVSAKSGIGINTFVHHLRVIYDSHLSSTIENKLG